MATAETRFIYVEQRAGLYRTQVAHDALSRGEDVAVLCFDFADVAAQGCSLFHSIKELNEDYRSLVASEELEYDDLLERRIVRLYAEWCQASLRALDLYRRIEGEYKIRGFDADRIEELQAYCAEATEILKEDADWAEIELHAMPSERIDAIATRLLSSGEASS